MTKQQEAYKQLQSESGLDPKEFNQRALALIKVKKPQSKHWLAAARKVLVALKAEAEIKTDNGQSAGNLSESDLQVLKLQPSRYALVSLPLDGPRTRRKLKQDRKKGKSERYNGVEKLTIKTESEQVIIDPKEHEEAKGLQGRLGHLLRRHGTRIADGLIVYPLANESEFDEERAKSREAAREFNAKSTHWKLRINVTKLEAVVSDQDLAAKTLAYEVQRIMDEMKLALESHDVERIREAAQDAKYKAASLAPGLQQGALEAAVSQARKVANVVAKEVREKGKLIESVKKKLDTSAVDSARMMFLDYDVPEEVKGVSGVNAERFDNLGDEAAEVKAAKGDASRFADL